MLVRFGVFFRILFYSVIAQNSLIRSGSGYLIHVPSVEPDIEEMAIIVRTINEKVFLSQTSTISIIINPTSREAEDYFNDLIQMISTSFMKLKVKIIHKNKTKNRNAIVYDYFNLVLVDSYEKFRQLDLGSGTQTKDFSEFYLIVFYSNSSENATSSLVEIFEYCWQYYMINVDIAMQRGGSIAASFETSQDVALYTYFPFQPGKCGRAVVDLLGVGKATITNLSMAQMYPSKVDNFHNCTIKAALWNVPPYIILPVTGVAAPGGIEGTVLKMMMEHLNFTLDYVIPPNDEQRGVLLPNGSTTGAIYLLQERIADLSLGCFRCTQQESTLMSGSFPVHQTMQVFSVLADHQPFDSHEIIAYPFDNAVWSTLICLLFTILILVFLLPHFRNDLLQFIFGCSNIPLICFNFISASMGMPTSPEPQRNFARYMLCMWFLLWLILRSAYQGQLFKFFNGEKTIAAPNTFAELARRNYKMIVNPATAATIRDDVDVIRNGKLAMTVINTTDAGCFPILEKERGKRYATSSPRDFLTYYVGTHHKYGVFHELPETVFAQHLCIYYTKHSFLTKRFNEIIMNLRSFGLIEFWSSQFLDLSLVKATAGQKAQRIEVPLTINQLKAVFIIQFYLWIAAAFVFFCELIFSRRPVTTIEEL